MSVSWAINSYSVMILEPGLLGGLGNLAKRHSECVALDLRSLGLYKSFLDFGYHHLAQWQYPSQSMWVTKLFSLIASYIWSK